MDRSNAMTLEEMDAFIKSLSSYTPAIPDKLVRHYLARAGFTTNDVRIERLIALAAQKFLADVSNDAFSHARIRQSAMPSQKKASAKDVKLTLTVDDLERAFRDYGVHLCKPPYFADSVNAGAPDPVPPKPTAPPQTQPKPPAK